MASGFAFEGVVVLFEDEAAPLRHLALGIDKLTAAAAFDTLGSTFIRPAPGYTGPHEATVKESMQQMEA